MKVACSNENWANGTRPRVILSACRCYPSKRRETPHPEPNYFEIENNSHGLSPHPLRGARLCLSYCLHRVFPI